MSIENYIRESYRRGRAYGRQQIELGNNLLAAEQAALDKAEATTRVGEAFLDGIIDEITEWWEKL
jgi:hypothetical protein